MRGASRTLTRFVDLASSPRPAAHLQALGSQQARKRTHARDYSLAKPLSLKALDMIATVVIAACCYISLIILCASQGNVYQHLSVRISKGLQGMLQHAGGLRAQQTSRRYAEPRAMLTCILH